MDTKSIVITILIVSITASLTILFAGKSNNVGKDIINNVSVVEGKQFIDINVKGGYSPRKSIAKSGIPTYIRFNTNGTFDCSSFIKIPSMNISQTLPQTGITEIDIGIPQTGKLGGMCGMGMYNFEVDFQ